MTAPAVAPPASRETYRDTLVELMALDDRVVCLDSDTGLFKGWTSARPPTGT